MKLKSPKILVKVGDKVEAEQSLITVEGDKASMEVPSPQAGIVKEIKVSVGDKTQTGALIMILISPTVQQTLHLLRQKRRRSSSGSSTSGCGGKRR